jgi:hypothetical protein
VNPIHSKVVCAMADDVSDEENVILVTFGEGGGAYEAMTALNELDSQKHVKVVTSAVVTRGDDGQIEVKDEVADYDVPGTAGGGIVGLLIGILGGPLGVLIGGATGVLVGSLTATSPAKMTPPAGRWHSAAPLRPRSRAANTHAASGEEDRAVIITRSRATTAEVRPQNS